MKTVTVSVEWLKTLIRCHDVDDRAFFNAAREFAAYLARKGEGEAAVALRDCIDEMRGYSREEPSRWSRAVARFFADLAAT